MRASQRKRAILSAGRELGFVDGRVARVERLEREAFYDAWLSEGRAGDMRFLLHHKKARLDPRSRYPWALSMVSAFFPYPAPPPALRSWRRDLRGRIAAYALGPDYHDVVGERLALWRERIGTVVPGAQVKSFVDTGAVLEHEWAARGGVGWTGKHTLTLSESRGSYAFLAELLLDVELEPDRPVPDRCGTCTRCLDACPTGAIEPGFRLDPRRCISYLTIEHRGVIPSHLRPGLGPWVFGCDECQTICPWNRDETSARADFLTPFLPPLLLLDEREFTHLYGGTAIRRTGRVGLARNAAVVLGNTGDAGAVRPLARALAEHDAALVRLHAAGALSLLQPCAGKTVRDALEKARDDPDDAVRAEVDRALESAEGRGERPSRR